MTTRTEPTAETLSQNIGRTGPCPSCRKPGQERPHCADCLAWARRTCQDPQLSRHTEVVRLGHYLRRDQIPLTRQVGNLVLDLYLANIRTTAAGSGAIEPLERREAARALRDAYRTPSEPDRPRLPGHGTASLSGGADAI